MFKYRVLSWYMQGNGIRTYTVLDLYTGEKFETRLKFFKEQGDDAFINARVGTTVNMLKVDKDVRKEQERIRELKKKDSIENKEKKVSDKVTFISRPMR